jgi:hypothetical protein
MGEKNYTGIVPENKTGEVINSVSSIELANTDEAKAFYAIVKQRLLDVNSWHKIAGDFTANFQLADKEGNEVNRAVKKGDYFKINIPGPGSLAGEGYDWVHVEDVNSVSDGDLESLGIRVRPASNPKTDSEEIAHFYSEDSTSNFTVSREGKKITSGIYDRNIKPNKDANMVDKTRDLLVGLGAIAGFSKFQWDKLAKGLLEREAG